MVLLLIACAPTVIVEEPAVYDGPTRIDELSFTCDEAGWTLAVSTVGWTSGGRLALSEDGLVMEEHSVSSWEASPTGHWDHLGLELGVVADPDDQRRDENTRFLCNEPTLAGLGGLVQILDPQSQGVADCRWWGPEIDWSTLGGYAACGTRLDGA